MHDPDCDNKFVWAPSVYEGFRVGIAWSHAVGLIISLAPFSLGLGNAHEI